MGIPIVAHLGLMPQSVGVMGYKLQGGTKDAAEQLIRDACRSRSRCSGVSIRSYSK